MRGSTSPMIWGGNTANGMHVFGGIRTIKLQILPTSILQVHCNGWTSLPKHQISRVE